MKEEGKGQFSLLALPLYLLSRIYGGVIRTRSVCYQKRWFRARKLPCTVISIGNITLGGTGKTPHTLYVARYLQELGFRVAILSRGYKGTAEKIGGIVSDGQSIRMEPDEAGDEPFMMARELKHVPVIVGQNRYAGGMMAIEQFQPDVIILDDGFQHRQLERDIDLVLLDYQNPFGNGYLFPRGILREEHSAIERGDTVILTRADDAGKERVEKRLSEIREWLPQSGVTPIFRSCYMPRIHSILTGHHLPGKDAGKSLPIHHIEELEGRHCFAFSGIARNEDFKKTVETAGCILTGWYDFPDHHAYTRDDLSNVTQMAEKSGAGMILTTQKDGVRLPDTFPWQLPVVIIGIDVSFINGTGAFETFLKDRLETISARKRDSI